MSPTTLLPPLRESAPITCPATGRDERAVAMQFGRQRNRRVVAAARSAKLQAWAFAAFVLAAQMPAARACELSFYGPLEEAPWFCSQIVAALDFEVISVEASPGDDTETMYDVVDEELGERTPNERWRPDAYEGPHFDVRIRQLARYGEHWPEQLAIIEEHNDGTPLSRPLLAPGTRWRLYRGHHARVDRLNEREIVNAGCVGNLARLDETHGPPPCSFGQKVERPAARGHGCASCSVGASEAPRWYQGAAWAIALGCLCLRRRRARSIPAVPASPTRA